VKLHNFSNLRIDFFLAAYSIKVLVSINVEVAHTVWADFFNDYVI